MYRSILSLWRHLLATVNIYFVCEWVRIFLREERNEEKRYSTHLTLRKSRIYGWGEIYTGIYIYIFVAYDRDSLDVSFGNTWFEYFLRSDRLGKRYFSILFLYVYRCRCKWRIYQDHIKIAFFTVWDLRENAIESFFLCLFSSQYCIHSFILKRFFRIKRKLKGITFCLFEIKDFCSVSYIFIHRQVHTRSGIETTREHQTARQIHWIVVPISMSELMSLLHPQPPKRNSRSFGCQTIHTCNYPLLKIFEGLQSRRDSCNPTDSWSAAKISWWNMAFRAKNLQYESSARKTVSLSLRTREHLNFCEMLIATI